MYTFKNVWKNKNSRKNEKFRALRALRFFSFFLNFFFHTFLKVWIKKNTILADFDLSKTVQISYKTHTKIFG